MRYKRSSVFLLGLLLSAGLAVGSEECPVKSAACSSSTATGPGGNGVCCRAWDDGSSPKAGGVNEEPGGGKALPGSDECGRYYLFNHITNTPCVVPGGACGGAITGPC